MRLPKQYSKMFEPYCTCCRKRWSFHLSKLVLVRNSLIQLSDTNRCAFWNCCAPQDAQSLLAFSLRECVRCAFLWPTIKLSPLLYCIIIIISVQVAAISLWGPCSEVSSFFCPFSPKVCGFPCMQDRHSYQLKRTNRCLVVAVYMMDSDIESIASASEGFEEAQEH